MARASTRLAKPGTKEGGKGDGQQDAGQGQKGVHGEGGESDVDPAAKVAGQAAYGEAQSQRDGDDGDGDGQRKARAEQQAGEGVAAEFVGSGPVSGAGAFETVWQVDGGGIGGREPGRGQSANDKKREQQGANHGQRLSADAIAEGGKCCGCGKRHWQNKNTATAASKWCLNRYEDFTGQSGLVSGFGFAFAVGADADGPLVAGRETAGSSTGSRTGLCTGQSGTRCCWGWAAQMGFCIDGRCAPALFAHGG